MSKTKLKPLSEILKDIEPPSNESKQHCANWIGYVKQGVQSKDIPSEDWDHFLHSSYFASIRGGGELSSLEKNAFKNNWDTLSSNYLKKIIKDFEKDNDKRVKNIREAKKRIEELLHQGGKNKGAFANRTISVLCPDILMNIAADGRIDTLFKLLKPYAKDSNYPLEGKGWIERNINIKKFLDKELNNKEITYWAIIDAMENMEELTTECIKLTESNYNLILTGAPGTGKTYLARQIAAAMIGCETEELTDKKYKDRLGFVQFHPSYDYTDFVEGLRPDDKSADGNIKFKRIDGVFKAFCKKAAKDANKYVFVIDEINRGEISKIFGELFFSIDPGYRAPKDRVKVSTQYQNLIKKEEDKDIFEDGFYVPENVYIIGTMNDIDRSVESMDFAFRRRFAFKEITAEARIGMLDDLDEKVKQEAKDRMKAINEVINGMDGLGPAYELGAAYFKKIEKYSGENMWKDLWKYHIEGIIKEYLRGMPDADTKRDELYDAYCLKNVKEANDTSSEGQSAED